jgi:hypothetical protein
VARTVSTGERILRAIAGLPLGTIFVVDRRLRLGRAPDSDIQLMHPGVSRHHARVEVDESGVVMLVDHSSRAGTSVDGVVVERTRLEHGSIITIGPFSLRFEVTQTETVRRRPPPRRAGIEALRITAAHEPARRRTTGVPVARAQPEAPTVVEPPSEAPSVGVLVRAIHELRSGGRGDLVAAQLMQTDREPGRRRHRRFACALQAWIARADGTRVATAPVDVLDLSAGGAQVSWRGDALAADGPQWLVVDLEHDDDDAPIVVFSARVAWSRPDGRAAGLEFVGAARRGIDAHELGRADMG